MLGIKDDTRSIVHLLLGILAQGPEFYNSQRSEVLNYFGEKKFNKAEEALKKTRLYELLMQY